ncbi:MAG: hypothetical protein IPH16_00305 [Haliscomenobacter sp.]|nr:hypothetical protein [Haliscomenobacter sp.]MBK7476752.1 hypothetical protein [Haliscomenobacter sp.]MBK8880782.1 hypothetical protein [Haliscomenobacter sp.]
MNLNDAALLGLLIGIKARCLKIDISGVNTCPEWPYGVGYNCWFFLDEVVLK